MFYSLVVSAHHTGTLFSYSNFILFFAVNLALNCDGAEAEVTISGLAGVTGPVIIILVTTGVVAARYGFIWPAIRHLQKKIVYPYSVRVCVLSAVLVQLSVPESPVIAYILDQDQVSPNEVQSSVTNVSPTCIVTPTTHSASTNNCPAVPLDPNCETAV